ncbi:MAG TPA: 7TM diverse intracellular signaling domain-containing protein [Ramlibacter sp.]|uniref:sensor domain-containing diguanylate cyclase n=1 Tax=Ramlibacter sp. TaxID=1917967 RepID=UPI002ED3A349
MQLAGQSVIHLNGKSLAWMDDGGGARVEDLEAGGDKVIWRTRKRDYQAHLDGGALWIQFEAAAPAGEHWYVEVGGSVYDSVKLFYRDAGGRWVVQEAGTQQEVAQWAVPGRLPTFALAASGAAPVRYWLRVGDERADFSSPVTLFREDALQASREKEQFLFGAYFGLAALVTAAAIVVGTVFRDKGFLAFALYTALLVAGQLGRVGVGAQYLWPEWQIWNNTVLGLWPGAAAAAALWFTKVVTNPRRLSRTLDLAVWGVLAAVLAGVALDLAVASRLTMTLVLSLTSLALVAIFGMLLWGWVDGEDRHLRLVAIGFLPVLLMALFPLARGFGLVPTSVLTRFGLFFGAALELPLIYYALNMRLMARRESELRASALSRTDALTGLPHRQALVERLDTSLAHARAQKQNCALLGVRISNLEAIAEEFGKEAVEKSLVIAASHLRRCAVGYDMAARVGEREFALLVEAPVTRQAVTSRAQQVVASGLRQMESLPSALTLKFHVTAAMLPDPQHDGAATLQWVHEGLDAIEPDARKLIKPLNF